MRWVAASIVVCLLVVTWIWWPVIDCDGDIVRGAVRMVCVR